jgi:hypothetical protein
MTKWRLNLMKRIHDSLNNNQTGNESNRPGVRLI